MSYSILEQLLAYAKSHLTCRAMATRFLLACDFPIQDPSAKLLFLNTDWSPDYQRNLLLTGLKRVLGRRCVAPWEDNYLYDSTPLHESYRLYGKGFSYTRVLPASLATTAEESKDYADRLSEFELVVYGSCHRGLPSLDAVKASGRKVALVCGEDFHKCEFGTCQKHQGFLVFIRELGSAL